MEEKLYRVVAHDEMMSLEEALAAAESTAKYYPGRRYAVTRVIHSVKVETTTTVKRTDYPPEAAATATPDDDGWIAWDGGKCPVELDDRVEVRLRSGKQKVDRADWFIWGVYPAMPHAGDIMAYRIAKPEATTAKPYAPSYNHTK